MTARLLTREESAREHVRNAIQILRAFNDELQLSKRKPELREFIELDKAVLIRLYAAVNSLEQGNP